MTSTFKRLTATTLLVFSVTTLYAQDDVLEKFRAARAAVQAFQQAKYQDELHTGAGLTGSEYVHEGTRELADAAQAALTQARDSLRADVNSGKLGEETGRLMENYQRELEKDFIESKWNWLDSVPLSPSKPSEAQPLPETQPPPKDDPLDGLKDMLKRSWTWILEWMASDIRSHYANAEFLYGYDRAPQTLRAAYERVQAPTDSVATFGRNIWLQVHDALGRMGTSVDIIRNYIDFLKQPNAQVDTSYCDYLRTWKSRWQADMRRFSALAARVVVVEAQCAASRSAAQKAGMLSSDSPAVRALEAQLNTLYKAVRDNSRLQVPLSYEAWNKLDGPGRESLTKQTERDSGVSSGINHMENPAEAAARGKSLGQLSLTLDGLRKEAEKGALPKPDQIKSALDNLSSVNGNRLDRFMPVLERIGENLKTAQDGRDYANAIEQLVSASRQSGEDRVQPLRDLGKFLKALKPIADEVPGIGGFLDYYADSIGLAADQLAEADETTQARLRDLTAPQSGEPHLSPADIALEEIDMETPELPTVADEATPPTATASPDPLSAADHTNIRLGSQQEQERYEQSQNVWFEQSLRVAESQDRLRTFNSASNAAGDPAERQRLEGELQRNIQDMRQANENLFVTRQAYENKVAELTRYALQRSR